MSSVSRELVQHSALIRPLAEGKLCQTKHTAYTYPVLVVHSCTHTWDKTLIINPHSPLELGILGIRLGRGNKAFPSISICICIESRSVCQSPSHVYLEEEKIVEQNVNAHLTDLLPVQTSHQIVHLPAENLHAIAFLKILLCNCYHQMMIWTTHINQMVSWRQHLQHLLSVQSHFYRVASL